MEAILNLKINQRVSLRKPHPCGGDEWSVVRLGADIGLKFETCECRVLLSRQALSKRLKIILDKWPAR